MKALFGRNGVMASHTIKISQIEYERFFLSDEWKNATQSMLYGFEHVK
jgi:hypothetical protein